MSHDARPFSYNGPRFPDRLQVRVPFGLKDRAKRVAAEQGIPFNEFIRRAVEGRLAAAEAR